MTDLEDQTKLIMVVDDDEDLAMLLSMQLKKANYRTQVCIGGNNLLEEIITYRPSLLLLDIAMQMVDGSELCRKIKKDPNMADVKILLVSGNHNVAEHASFCGADGFLAKPLSVKNIINTVAKYI